jgi:hypothetical protein
MAAKGTLFGKPRDAVVKRPGAFTAKADKAGKSTGAYAKSVLKPSSSASTRTKKQAALAQTFAKLRAGKAKFVLPLMLGLATASHAASITCPGWLIGPAPQAAVAVGPGQIVPRGASAMVVQAVSPSGTASVQLEMCCSPIDCTQVTGVWAVVTGSVMALAAATPTAVVSVTAPACTYRANVTACSGCAVNVAAACSGP